MLTVLCTQHSSDTVRWILWSFVFTAKNEILRCSVLNTDIFTLFRFFSETGKTSTSFPWKLTLSKFSFLKVSAMFSGFTHVLIWTRFSICIYAHTTDFGHISFSFFVSWGASGPRPGITSGVKEFKLRALTSSVSYRPWASFQNGCCVINIFVCWRCYLC